MITLRNRSYNKSTVHRLQRGNHLVLLILSILLLGDRLLELERSSECFPFFLLFLVEDSHL